jgi:hypothetical protein
MTPIKPSRPKPGLGLGSAITREQIVTRRAQTTKTRKPPTPRSRKPDRRKADKR